MRDFKFNLQRFAATITDGQVAIPAGETFTLDGVTYTAGTNGATLNATTTESDDTYTATAVTGIASGTVTATAAGTDATITFDASDGAVDFTATSDGSVINARMVLPLEIISGEYTFDGTTLGISAGSNFAIVTTQTDYSLRNENTFVYDGTYTFSGASMISDCERVISIFTLTNGTDTRTLNLEQRGPVVNNFLERGFTLLKGSSEVLHHGDYTLTATAIDDAALNISLDANGLTLVPTQGDGTLNVTLTRGDTPILAGELECTSGEIIFGYDSKVTLAKDTSFQFTQGDYVLTATTTDTASASVSLTDDGFTFTPGDNDGGLTVVLIRGGTPVFGGELNVSGGTISFDPTTQKVSFTEGTEVSIALGGDNPQEFAFKVTGGDASFKAVADGAGNFVITPDEGDGSLDITLKQNGQTVFANNISISGGSILIGNMGQTIGLTAGTTVNVTLGNYRISATADDDASFKLGVQSDGSIAITPTEGDGKLDIAIQRDGTQIFSNKVSVNSGTITFNPTTQAITLKDGTEISLSFGDYELIAKANGDATSVMSLTGNGIEIKPNAGDGSLDLTLQTASGSINANLDVLSGSFILSDGGKITVTKGTELKIDFGDGYIVNFKAIDDAGGSLSLGADGITFTPGSDDGGLELSITRDGETRTASLDVTGGSVTYKLDGSISLTQGTVVKNVFEDGNILIITANTDAGGSMTFTPNSGLTITPATTDALTVSLTTGDLEVAKFTSIDGSINYTGGIVTASDGTSANLRVYDTWDTKLSTDGGTASLQFTADRTVYTANEGATFVLDYLDGTTVEIQNGSYSDIYATETEDAIELVSVGSTFKSNDDEFVFTLEKAGNYNLNGFNVTTTEDNVQVQLGGDYDTIAFAQDAPIKISVDEKAFMISATDEAIQLTTSTGNIEVTSGEITFDNAAKTLSATTGTTVNITQGNYVLTTTTTDAASVGLEITGNGITFTPDNDGSSVNVVISRGDTPVFSGNVKITDGSVTVDPTTRRFSFTEGTNISVILGGNISRQVDFKVTGGDAGITFETDSDGKIVITPDENDGALQITVSRDGTPIFQNTFNVSGGSITFDPTTQKLGLTSGTTLNIGLGNYTISATADDDASFQIGIQSDGNFVITPTDGDGSLDIAIQRGDTTIFSNKVSVSGGSITINPETLAMTLSKGTEITLSFGDYELQAKTTDDATVGIAITGNGIAITPTPGDGSLDLTFKSAGGEISANVEVVSGSFVLRDGGALTVAKDTELKIDFGDGYVVNFKATDDAGGSLSLGADGITFKPGSDDGGLELSITRDGETRTTNLNVTGSVTYKLDGTLSLAQGTVISNTWEDGAALKITATNDGVSNVRFDPDTGLTVTDSEKDLRLELTLPNGGVFDIDEITGTVIYKSGAVTLNEGTAIHMDNQSVAEQSISVDSGTAVIDFTEMADDPEVSMMGYTISDNGSVVVKTLNVDKALILTGGTFKSGKNIQLLLPDSSIYGAAGDGGVGATTFSLDGDGEYTVNGFKVTVSNIDLHDKEHYGTAIRLIDNKAIMFSPGTATIAYDGTDFTGNGIVSLSEDGVRLGDGVIATGFDVGKTVVLYEKGSVTIDGKIFELTEDVSAGVSVTGTADGFVMSSLDDGKIFTESFGTNDDNYRVQLNSGGLQKIIGISDGATVTGGATYDGQPDSQAFYFVTDTTGTFTVGKKPYVIGGSASVAVRTHFDDSIAAANGFDNLNGTVSGDFTSFPTTINGGDGIKILGDTTVSISANSNGVELFGLSDGAILADTGGALKAHTDTTGAFVFGEGVGDSIGVTVQNDPNVTFEFNTDTQIITNINDIEGNLIFSETSHMCTINGIGGVFSGNFASVGATADMLRLYEVADGSSLVTGDADKIWLQERGNFKLNDNELTLTGDADGIWLRDKEVVGLDEGASLTVSEAGNYTVNGQSLTAKAGDTFVGLDDGNDAYIYDENNQLLTKNTPTERIVAMFPNANEVSIVGASATGRQVPVSLSGGDLAVVESTNAKVSVSAGDADTVVSKGGNVELNLRGGKTDIFPLDGRMSLTGNYDPSNATGFGTTYANVMTALQNGQLAYSNGELKIDSAQVYFGTNGELVNIFDRVGKLQKVGFAEHDASINAGNATDNLILSGGDYATLISGSGNDTILAAEGSSIDAGDGSNFIELASSRDTLKVGAVINVDKGNNTVTNFRAGFGYNADFVAKSDDSWDSSFDGTNVSIKTDSGTTVLQSVGSGEAFAKVKTYEAGIEYSVAIVQKNSVMTGGDIANIYVGDYSGVDFTGFNGLLLANLHEESAGRAVDQAICFYGVNSLTAGDGQNTLSGSEYVETLSGGKGDSSLWTDAGNDVMIGGDGYDEFFFLANDGRDVVKNFDFDKDAINILTNEATAASVDSSGNVVLQINHGDDALIIENAAGKNFRINNLVMNVDRNPVYNDEANCFVATGSDAILTVTESAEIWMDNTHGKFYIGDIKTIDAFDSTGETKLAGNELDNNIIAGNGDSSLWGGNGGNDTLVGGNGRNVFFYAYGNGSDEVLGTNDGDVVNLAGLTLAEISSSEITSDGVTLNFTDGGKLLVNGTNAVDFQLNGETYSANHDSGQWTKK